MKYKSTDHALAAAPSFYVDGRASWASTRGRDARRGVKPRSWTWLLAATSWSASALAQPPVAPAAEDAPQVEAAAHLMQIDSKTDAPTSVSTPCDAVFELIVAAMRSEQPETLQAKEMLSVATASRGCFDWLDAQTRLPDEIQRPLDALAARSLQRASAEEDVAARALCALKPAFGFDLIRRLNRTHSLPSTISSECYEALQQEAVITARSESELGVALAKAAIRESLPNVTFWALPLIKSRQRVRRAAGPLLLAAKQKQLHGFDELRGELCLPTPPATLVTACAETSEDHEYRWRAEQATSRQARRQRQVLTRFGIATVVTGGLTGLAYLGRESDGGRAIAIGSGSVVGAALGVGMAVAVAGNGGDSRGLAALLLAAPLAVVGGIGGGILTASTSREPGNARFASAAIPLGGVWLFSIGLTLDAL